MVNYYIVPGIKKKPVSAEKVIKVVCEYLNKPVGAVFSKSRKNDLVLPRHAIIYFLSMELKMNNSAIANIMNLDHTSITHALKTTKNRIELYNNTAILFNILKEKILLTA